MRQVLTTILLMLSIVSCNIDHLQQPNLSGICEVIYVEREGVQSMPSLKSIMASPNDSMPVFLQSIILKEGYSWHNFSSDLPLDWELAETPAPGNQGTAFGYTLTCRIPNDDWETRGKAFLALDNREFIVAVKERNGTYRIIGNTTKGATFQAGLGTGKTRQGLNATTCAFTYQAAVRAFYARSWSYTSHFTMALNDEHVTVYNFYLNEPYEILWGDGTSDIVSGGGTIVHDYAAQPGYSGGDKQVTVRHNDLATVMKMNGDVDVNGTVFEFVSQHLPYTLTHLEMRGNDLTGTLNSPVLTYIDYRDNALPDESTEALLEELVNYGNHNGTLKIEGQDGTPALTTAAAGYVTTLNSRGWTITHD